MSVKTSLYPPFFLALFATLFAPIFFPFLHLSTFAPFLALLYNRHTLVRSLWTSALCGTLLDMTVSYSRFGIYTLNFVLVTFFLYPQKKFFFEEKPMALSLFTVFISAASTLLQLLLLYIFEQGSRFSWITVVTDVFLYPCLDGVYAFLWFTCLLKLYNNFKKMGWKQFFIWMKNGI